MGPGTLASAVHASAAISKAARRKAIGAVNLTTGHDRGSAGRRRPMQDQRPCEEFRTWREIVEDPLTRLVMKADGVRTEDLLPLRRALEPRRRADLEAARVFAFAAQ